MDIPTRLKLGAGVAGAATITALAVFLTLRLDDAPGGPGLSAPSLEEHMPGFRTFNLRDLSNDDMIPDYVRDGKVTGYLRLGDDFEIVVAGSVMVDEDLPRNSIPLPALDQWGPDNEMIKLWKGFFNDMLSPWAEAIRLGEDCEPLDYPRILGNISGTTACPILARRIDTHEGSPFRQQDVRRLTLEATAFARDRHLGIVMVFYQPGGDDNPRSVDYAHYLDRSIVDHIREEREE